MELLKRVVTESELAKMDSADNTRAQELVDLYLTDPIRWEKECHSVVSLLKGLDMCFAGMVFSSAMAKMHTTIGHQTSTMLGAGGP